MTKRIPEPRPELAPGIREHEARLLAAMLRTSRLTCLLAELGTDKTDLLKSGVMPLLQRRHSDRIGPLREVAVHPFAGTDRRRKSLDDALPYRAEVAVYFGTWTEDCLSDLTMLVDSTAQDRAARSPDKNRRLLDSLLDLNRRSGAEVVLLLDRFEDFLALPMEREAVSQFLVEFAEALSSRSLSATFLVSLDEVMRSRLDCLRSVIPDIDHNSLRLSPTAAEAPPQATALTSLEDATTALRRGPLPRAPITVDDVYAFIEAKLSATSTQVSTEPRRDKTKRPSI